MGGIGHFRNRPEVANDWSERLVPPDTLILTEGSLFSCPQILFRQLKHFLAATLYSTNAS